MARSTARYAENTEVPAGRSRDEIERALARYGATSFAYGWNGALVQVGFELEGRQILFRVPMPRPGDDAFVWTPTRQLRSDAAAQREYEKAVRQRWRALALVIKAKLEAVAAGITTVEEEFLAHIVLPSGDTFGQWAAPQLARVYAANEMPALMPGGSS